MKTYNHQARQFHKVYRANQKKFLSVKAQILAKNYFNLLRKSKKDYLVVKHDFISSITHTSIKQNLRLHAELKNLFLITYHKKFMRFFFCFKISLTEKAEEILADPESFYDVDNSVDNSVDNLEQEDIFALLPESFYVDNPVDNLEHKDIFALLTRTFF